MGTDTKRLITGMLLALAVLLAYNWILHALYPGDWNKANPGTTPPVASTQISPSTTHATTVASTQGSLQVTTAPSQNTWHARGSDGGMPAQIGSPVKDDPKFAMGVEIYRKGAAINSVKLNEFLQTAENKQLVYTFQQPDIIGGDVREDTRSLQTRTIAIDGHAIDLADVTWKLDHSDATSATFSVDILNADKPVARVFKTYNLTPRSDDPKTSRGFVMMVGTKVENLTDQPMTISSVFNGPTIPPRELERQADQSFIFGYYYDGTIKVEAHLVESEFTKEKTFKEFTRNEKGLAMVWGGAQSAYFNAIIRPIPFSPKDPTPSWIGKVSGELLNPAAENADDRRVVMRIETGNINVAAKGSTQFDLEAYFGPKGRKVLNTEYYSAAERRYDETLVITPSSGISWFCSLCTFQWLISILVGLLTAFHLVLRDWGLAIIGLVLLVRLLLHPITKKSQVHMVKMQKMGPEMEKLKKKYADDKDALAKAQMQFYKEQGMTPVLGCLPMFLQMPIWIALWNSLQSTFELRHSPFLYGWTWIQDLSKPDYLIHFAQPIPLFLFGWHLSGINILPILMGVVMFLQQKYQPKPATLTPEQQQQQKMMVVMSTLLFPIMLYTGPSGLNLYIMTSTAFGIIESKVIRKHIKEREELEKLGPTIVDEPPPDKGGGGSRRKEDPKAPKPKNWLARLQERAEQIKNEGDRRKR